MNVTEASAIAIDLGAGSGRVVTVTCRAGRLDLEEAHRFPTPLFRDTETGYDCWDLDLIEAQAVHGLRLAQRQAPIQSVGIDSWGVDYVLLDGEQRRLGPAVSYRDGRTQGVLEQLLARMPAEQVYRRTGIQFLPLNTLVQLAQTAGRHPGWLRDAQHFLMLPDYLHYRLCGVMANEYSNASTTQMLDVAQRAWDPELLALAGLQPGRMISPVDPGTVLADLDRRFGAGPEAVVIAPATHDTASAIAAIPFEDDNEVFLSSGTWSLMGFESADHQANDQAFRFNFSSEGGVAGRYQILKTMTGLWPVQQLAKETGLDHAAMVQAAGQAPAWVSLIHPDDARFRNPPSMAAAIRAFCAETGQPEPASPGCLARCVFDSLALSYRTVLGQIRILRGHQPSTIRIVGGGSQNRLLNQLCADACQIPVQAGPTETSAIGNACLQFLARDVFRSLAEAREHVRRSCAVETYLPSKSVPEQALGRFRTLQA